CSKPEHANQSWFRGRFHGGHGAVSCLVVSLGSNLECAVAENTAFVIGVMELGAGRTDAAAHQQKEFGSTQHAERRRREIYPKGMQVAAWKCPAKGSGGIHAHS